MSKKEKPVPTYAAYLGRKCIAKGDDYAEISDLAVAAVKHTGKNPWKGRHNLCAIIWNNANLSVIACAFDDSNGVNVWEFPSHDHEE